MSERSRNLPADPVSPHLARTNDSCKRHRACPQTCRSWTSKTPLHRLRRKRPVPRWRRRSATRSWDERVLCVRMNAWDTHWTYGDVIEVVRNAGERLDEIMLPKVQSAAEVVALDLLLTQLEKTNGLPHRHIGIEAQIETTRRAHRRRRHLCRVGQARGDHLRPGRLRCLHGDAGAHGGSPDPGVPRRPFQLRVLTDLDGGQGERPAGDRRALSEGEGHRRVARLRAAHPDPRVRRQVGAHP